MKRVQPGQRLDISAVDWNACLAAAEFVRNYGPRLLAGSQGQMPGVGSREVLVKNTSAGDVDRFGVLKLGRPIITATDNEAEFCNRITFVGDTPTSATDDICIMLEPKPSGHIGRAVIYGTVQCKVEVASGAEEYRYAVPKTGTIDKLEAVARGPVRILDKEAGTGDKWAIVNLQPLVEPQWPLLCWVTGAVAVGDAANKQWLYNVAEVDVTIDNGAYPAYSLKANGWSGHAYDILEDSNAAAAADASGDTFTGVGITPNQMGENFALASLDNSWLVSVWPQRVKVLTTTQPDPEEDPITTTTYETKYFCQRANPMVGGCAAV